MILHTLPFEIIELISLYTNTQDLLNVIHVSKTWYRCFHTFLYRSISIDSEEKQHRVLSGAVATHYGHYVRSLTLRKTPITASIPKLFPNMDTLELDWNIWGPLDDDNFDTEAPFSYIHPPQGLPSIIQDFFYGIHNLQHLTVDAFDAVTTDIWSILVLCTRLKSLKLLNLNHEHIITLGYLETIHQSCPQLTSLTIKCTRSDPNPTFLPQFNNNEEPIILQPTLLEFFSLSSKSGASKWPLWLPYFSVKYPHLQHLFFKHLGLGKDGNTMVPESVYRMFTQGCQHLKSIRWSKIVVQHDLFAGGDQFGLQRIEAYENFLIPGSLEYSPIVQRNTLMSNLLTSLTIGQPPAQISTDQVIEAIGGCKSLTRLKVQECFGDPELAFDVNTILTHCKKLEVLYFKDVHVKSSCSSSQQYHHHSLKKLNMKRSSFTQDVFHHISTSCPKLDHVELLACFQTDRRDQLIIHLPHHQLTTLKIQGLRIQRFFAGCRPRFFCINQDWYYMTSFDIRYHSVGQKMAFLKYRNMEFARSFYQLQLLQQQDQQLRRLVTKDSLKAWDIDAIAKDFQVPPQGVQHDDWDPENIYYSGLVQINCLSVQNLFINNKLLLV